LRHANRIRRSRLDQNAIAREKDLLLRSLGERPISQRGGAQLLDGFHHLRWLLEKGAAQRHRPIQVGGHPLDYFGIIGQPLDADIPRLVIK
jgi:hypothetical protein